MKKINGYKKHLQNFCPNTTKETLAIIDKCLTVGDLKKALAKVSDDTPVLVRNYEEALSCSEVICRQAHMEGVPQEENSDTYTDIFVIEGVIHDKEIQKEYEENLILE